MKYCLWQKGCEIKLLESPIQNFKFIQHDELKPFTNLWKHVSRIKESLRQILGIIAKNS